MIQVKKSISLKIVLLSLMILVIIGIPAIRSNAESVTKRTLLGMSIDYCDKMDKTKYTADTWKDFQKELKQAKAVYKKTDEENQVYITARNELETSKSYLMFIPTKEKGNPVSFRKLTSSQIVSEMGAGWNLGNTMDGHNNFTPSETAWQPYMTTKELIKSIHDMGFNTIRIPITWGTMIDDKNNFKINEAWISRVQDIVDYCISQDMYVIINIHHDGVGNWLNVQSRDIDPVYNKYEYVWRNIAERFKDYDEHLIFEALNEVMPVGTVNEANRMVMNFDQIFVNVVRSTGSNNSVRWLSVPGRYANIEATATAKLGFDVPKDTIKNRIFVAVHDYEYKFGLTTTNEVTTYSYDDVKKYDSRFKLLYDRFTSKGIPVILGEYGAVNKNNTPERTYYYEATNRICQRYGIVPCAWDQGWYDFNQNPDYTFSIVDRATNKPLYPDIVSAIMRGAYLKTKVKDYSDIVKSPKITNITGITPSDTTLSLQMGDSKTITVKVSPSNTNDVVLWKTQDANIATVSGGHVRARGIGTTTLTAFSQSGSVQKEIKVTVKAKKSSKVCKSVKVNQSSYSLVKGKYVYLKASLSPSTTDSYVTYQSSNDSVATVSSIGKILAVAEGNATITVTTSNGLTKKVEVKVTNN